MTGQTIGRVRRTTVGAAAALAMTAGMLAGGVSLAVPAVAADTGDMATLVEVDKPGTTMISAAPFDVGDYGYVEREFFASGEANQYLENGVVFGNTRPTLDTAAVGPSAGDYKTRVVVRQPSAEKFNGTLVVEWTNVTTGQDGEFVFGESNHSLLRDGYAVAVISAQEVGVNNLVATRPERYGDLHVAANCGTGVVCPRDTSSWDIFGEVTQALRDSPDSPFADLDIQTVIATGQSQSAGLVGTFYNKIEPINPVFDGFVTYDGGAVVLRSDLPTPAIAIKAEISPSGPYQWKSSQYTRIWEAAGLSHGSAYVHEYMDAVFTRDGTQPGGASFTDWLMNIGHCSNPNVGTKVRIGHVEAGAFAAVTTWARGGQPAAATTLFERDANGVPLRDERGRIKGGIQIADAAAPHNTYGQNTGGWTCTAAGWHGDYTLQELEQLYVSHDQYVAQVTDVTDAALTAGYIVPGDATETIAEAAASDVAETDIAVTGSASATSGRVGSTVQLAVTPQLVRGAWLESNGAKVPVTVSGKAYFTTSGGSASAKLIWERDLQITDLNQADAGVLTLPKQKGTVTVVWCIDRAKQTPQFPGHVNETCTSDPSSFTVNVVPDERAKASLTVSTSPTVATTSKSVTVNARVTPGTVHAAGFVTVGVAGRSFTGTVTDGRASVGVGKLPRGLHLVTVEYAGSETVQPTTGYGFVLVLR